VNTAWIDRWENDDIGFHRDTVNERLVRFIDQLQLPTAGRVFVPLCGKTVDISWLLEQGYQVVGAELSEVAVSQLFGAMKIRPSVLTAAGLTLYSGKNIDIFVGDIFNVDPDSLGPVDAVYDRGALVALPELERKQYVPHVRHITGKTRQLLITCRYDQSKIVGSPYPIDRSEIERLYGGHYETLLLESAEIPDGVKGIFPAIAETWLLR